MRWSVLDLGSNSFHVLVADVHDEGWVDPVARERQMLHLGRVVAEHGRIPDDVADVAVEAVAHLSDLARRTGATEHLAVATSALRDAANGPEVLARMGEAAGTPVRVLPGTEEARLSYLGVRAAMGVTAAGKAVLDLGGGSLELAIGTHRTPDLVTSANLGVSRLSALVDTDPIDKHGRKAIRRVVDDELQLSGGAFTTTLPALVTAVGGTVRAMARVIAAQDHPWSPMTLNLLPVTRTRIDELCDQLVGLDRAGRAALPGMKSRRADLLHVAALIMSRVMERLEIELVHVCDWGLREGALLDAASTRLAPAPEMLRSREIGRMVELFSPDDPHPPRVARLALQLFDGTRQLHGLGDDDRELLRQAALVHAIGQGLALRRYQHHGAYILENAELRGFTPGRMAMLVTLVRFHPSRGISSRWAPYLAMHADRQRRTRLLLGLLQVADGLDRTRDQAAESVRVTSVDDRRVTIEVVGRDLRLVDSEIERRAAVFRAEFGRSLRAVAVSAGGA